MAEDNQAKGNMNQKMQNKAPTKQWADLFKKISKPSPAFKLKKWNLEDRAIEQDELKNLGICLVAYILGRFPGWQAVERVRTAWGVDCSCTMHDSGWIIFRFNSEEDRDSVMERGPYETSGAPWIMKKMPPFFKFNEDSFTTIPTWVRLYGLPLDFWSENALGKIASYIGEPLAADEGTVKMTKTSFARILVEIEVYKPVVREVQFTLPDGTKFVQAVTFEREPKLCTGCFKMGHLVEDCRKRQQAQGSQSAQLVRRDP